MSPPVQTTAGELSTPVIVHVRITALFEVTTGGPFMFTSVEDIFVKCLTIFCRRIARK